MCIERSMHQAEHNIHSLRVYKSTRTPHTRMLTFTHFSAGSLWGRVPELFAPVCEGESRGSRRQPWTQTLCRRGRSWAGRCATAWCAYRWAPELGRLARCGMHWPRSSPQFLWWWCRRWTGFPKKGRTACQQTRARSS